MPRFDTGKEMVQHNLPNNFGFSGERIDKLKSTKYTLVTIVCDDSPSIYSFKNAMEECLKQVIQGCRKSSYMDSLLVRTVTFNRDTSEVHGFRRLTECKDDDYTGALTPRGSTSLYDACYEAIEATRSYGNNLYDNEYEVNGIMVVITDGEDNTSKMTAGEVGKSVKAIFSEEQLDSMKTILIGVNTASSNCSGYLQRFKDIAGFDQFVDISDLDATQFAKLAEFISKSISAQSQALGTGGASQSLAF